MNKHLEEVGSLHVATESELLSGYKNQQHLDKLLGVVKDLNGKLQSVNNNSNSLVTKLPSLDNG